MVRLTSCRREAQRRVPCKLNNVRTQNWKSFVAYANKHQKRVLNISNDVKQFFWELESDLKDYIRFGGYDMIYREFDPGSGWTLAACLTHASRTELFRWSFRMDPAQLSGGRVSNAWATCPSEGDNSWKRLLIPHNVFGRHLLNTKGEIRWGMGSRLIS